MLWLTCAMRVLHAQIGASNNFMCGLRENASIGCWGWINYKSDEHGQLNYPLDGTFYQVSVGLTHSCAVLTDGDVTCWGEGKDGQLSFAEAFQDNTDLATLFVFDDDDADDDDDVELADDDTKKEIQRQKDLKAEIEAAKEQPTFTQVSAGFKHTCAVQNGTEIGEIKCWGRDESGESTPPLGKFLQVSAGVSFSCGIRDNRTLACWGKNDFAQANPPMGEYVQVDTGEWHACAIRNDSKVICWGGDDYNQGKVPEHLTFWQISTAV